MYIYYIILCTLMLNKIHTYIHIYIHAYIHTYIHTYITGHQVLPL